MISQYPQSVQRAAIDQQKIEEVDSMPEGSCLEKVSILGVKINVGSIDEFSSSILRLANRERSSCVYFVNAHMAVEASKNDCFTNIVNESDLACPDGMPIAKSIEWFHSRKQERISGPEMLPILMELAFKRNKRVFVLGGTQEVLDAFSEKANIEFPGILCGIFSPPFRAMSEQENSDIVAMINRSNADMIFVSLGCPNQEKWIAKNKINIKGCMLAVGFAVPVYAEHARRAPEWMQRLGLEWLHRLSKNPKNLWKRYLFTNSVFILMLIKAFLIAKSPKFANQRLTRR